MNDIETIIQLLQKIEVTANNFGCLGGPVDPISQLMRQNLQGMMLEIGNAVFELWVATPEHQRKQLLESLIVNQQRKLDELIAQLDAIDRKLQAVSAQAAGVVKTCAELQAEIKKV